MRNKNILKVLSLLAAVCIVAGCNGSTATETTTPTTTTVTTQITTAMTTAVVTEETTTAEAEEADEIKYCKIPEGMTFEDLCKLIHIDGNPVKLPCTVDEFLSVNENLYTYSEPVDLGDYIFYDFGYNGFPVFEGAGKTKNSILVLDVFGEPKTFNMNTNNWDYSSITIGENIKFGENISKVEDLFNCYSAGDEYGTYRFWFKKENKTLFICIRSGESGEIEQISINTEEAFSYE